jgi:TatD DNase family protein
LTRGLIDTHCHLNHEDFAADRDSVKERAYEGGVERLLVIGCDLAGSRFAVAMAQSDFRVKASIGIHPESCFDWNETTKGILVGLHQQAPDAVAAWGEIGLDYHYGLDKKALQLRVFSEQLDCAVESGLPAVMHCRDAYGDLLDCVARCGGARGVLHCFTGTIKDADRALALGLNFGIGGIATFKKSVELRRVISGIPLDRILLETDSPYLAPQPWRGKRNEPAYIVAVAQMLAEARGLTFEEIALQTSLNADRLFGPAHEHLG